MRNLTNLFGIICFAFMVIACGPSSVKGKWTDDDKKQVKEGFIKVAKETLAANGQSIDDATLDKIADCFTNKVEAEFDGTSAYNEGLAKRKEISDACAQEFSGGAPSGEETQPTETQATDSTQTAQ